MLRLQRAHEAPASIFFFPVHVFLRAHFDLREQRDGLELHAIQHGGEELEGLALVLVAVVLLRVAAQMDALAQVVHGGQMIAPVLVQHAQHHVLLDVAHHFRADAGDLAVVGLRHFLHDAIAERGLLELRLAPEPAFRLDACVEVLLHGFREPVQVPVRRHRALGQVLVEQSADGLGADALDRRGQVVRAHDLGALLVHDLALVVGHVVEQQQLLADVEVVRLDLALRLLDLAREHAALDDLAFLHAGHLQQPLRAIGVAEDAHEVVFHRQIEAARARVALAAGAAAQLVVDAADSWQQVHDTVPAWHLVVPRLPFFAYPRAGDFVHGLPIFAGHRGELRLEVAAEHDVRAAAGHVGGDGDGARPAGLTMCASRSCCLAFSTWCVMPSFCSRPERNSEVSMDVVPTSAGCSRVTQSRMSSMIAWNCLSA